MTDQQTIWPHCQHCQGHGAPWFGSDTLTDDGAGHTVPCQNCQAVDDE